MTARRLAAVQKGTIVRSFALLERVAPAAGARWAERLWFSVPQARGRGDRLTAPGRQFRLDIDGRAVAGELWGEDASQAAGGPGWNDRPVVYLVHGWGGWRWQLDALVEPLVEAGFRVVAFDAPSHGESDPGPEGVGRSTILEFADALAAVVAAHGPAHAIVAHSLGATAVAYAVRLGLPVGRLVFISPMADPLPYTRTFAGRLGFGERVRTRLVARLERRIGMSMSAFDVPAMAGKVPTPALLLVHDRQDTETGWSDSAAIAQSWPDARLLSTSGLGHRRILRAPAVVAEVVGFVACAPGDRHPDRRRRASRHAAATTAARGTSSARVKARRWPAKPSGR
jgi:pimeloyl-ACP methyl ester carboxylesterase